MLRLVVLVSAFAAALTWLYFLSTMTPTLPQNQQLQFPSSLEDLKKTAQILSSLFEQDSQSSYVIVLFISAYLFKQTFAIPGSVFLNALAGAVFGLKTGFGLVCTLTACGATFCFLLARFVGQDVALKFFPAKINSFKKKLEDNYDRLPYFLLFLRLFPATPNWAVNMCCGVLNVPIHIFFITALVGLMPYNYVCVQTGVIISKLTNMSDMMTWTTLAQMSLVAIVALVPGVIMKKKHAQQ